MPTIKPDLRQDPLAGRVQVEASLVYEIFVLVRMLSTSMVEESDAPREWMARMRRRLQTENVHRLDDFLCFLPFTPVLKIAPPRTPEKLFETMEGIPGSTFVDEITEGIHLDDPSKAILVKLRETGVLSRAEQKALEDLLGSKGLMELALRVIPTWKDQARLKKVAIEVCRDIYENVLVREKERIWPYLEASATRARDLIESKILPVRQVIEGLTNGLTLSAEGNYQSVLLVPSFYNAPYVTTEEYQGGILILFPARPEGMTLDGGTLDSEQLLQRLKALADKTRLDILKLLSQRSYNNQELAEALNLTQPTISHHMRDLRVAGLVRVEVQENSKQYSLNGQFVNQLAGDLKLMLHLEPGEPEDHF